MLPSFGSRTFGDVGETKRTSKRDPISLSGSLQERGGLMVMTLKRQSRGHWFEPCLELIFSKTIFHFFFKFVIVPWISEFIPEFFHLPSAVTQSKCLSLYPYFNKIIINLISFIK